jgi:hypothetical protein
MRQKFFVPGRFTAPHERGRVLLALVGAFLVSCAEPATTYRVSFPKPPELWTNTLGPPAWELRWVDGALRSARYPPGTEARIELPQERAVPVLALPFWPEATNGASPLPPGTMKGAGAIFPFDAEQGVIRLSWEGGVSAEFYLALAKARASASASPADKRRPDWFDWPRFRALLESGDIPEAIREDPWLADWDAVAAKTVKSGWDRRSIKVMEHTAITVTIPADGPWFGASPFAPVRLWQAGERAELPASEIPALILSPAGYLKYTNSDHVWRTWNRE